MGSIVTDLAGKVAREMGRQLGLVQQLVDDPKDKAAISVSVALAAISVAAEDMRRATGETPEEAASFLFSAYVSIPAMAATAREVRQ